MNKLARAITKWTWACDQRTLSTFDLVHSSHLWIQTVLSCGKQSTRQCRLGLFQDSDFAGDLEDSKSTSGGLLCILGSHTFVPKKLDVQERDISFTRFNRSWNYFSWCRITHGWNTSSWSLGFGCWSVSFFTKPVKETKDQVRGDSSCNTTSNKHTQNQTKIPTHHDNLELSNVDYVSSNAKSSQLGAMLYIFWKTTKQWLKWSSKAEVQQWDTYPEPTELLKTGCLTELIRIRRFDTNKQLADMLTEGNFTRDEWNHLLRSFKISHFSWIYCSQNFSLTSCTEAMAKRIQEQKREERIVAKSKPTLNLASLVSANSSTVQSPIALKARDTWSKRLQSRRSVEFSSVAKRCSSGWKYEETGSDRRRPWTPEFPWRFKKYGETRRFRKRRHQRQRQNLATQSPYIYRLRTTRRGFLDCKTKIWSQSERQNWKLSIWTQQYGVYSCPSLFKLQVMLVQTIRRFFVLPGISPRKLSDSCFKWLGSYHWPNWNYLLVLQRLIGSNSCGERERGDPADWQGCSFCNRRKMRLFWLSAMSGTHQSRTYLSLRK